MYGLPVLFVWREGPIPDLSVSSVLEDQHAVFVWRIWRPAYPQGGDALFVGSRGTKEQSKDLNSPSQD
jgi:hypothetical protein